MSREWYPSVLHHNKIAEIILQLKQHGSSLVLNWGEDDDCWEVAFISGGVRYVSVHLKLLAALEEVQKKAMEGAVSG